jgi:pyruvate formate lyase activating enzyme
MVVIKGIQKTSMIDYPGKISAILFTGGCNMRCPFCQNPDLISNQDQLPDLDEEKILDFLKKRKKWLDGICITGGEPLIHKDISDLIKKIKSLNYAVKLDTNGLNPGLLQKLIDQKLIDYIAMDIKSDKENYAKAAGLKTINLANIQKSIDIIKASKIDYEFRSTIVPDFYDTEVIKNIGNWLKGSKKYVLQQFRSTMPLLDKKFQEKEPYQKKVLDKFKVILDGSIDNIEIRV